MNEDDSTKYKLTGHSKNSVTGNLIIITAHMKKFERHYSNYMQSNSIQGYIKKKKLNSKLQKERNH